MKRVFVQINLLFLISGLLLVSAAAQNAKKTSVEQVLIKDGKGVLGFEVGKSTRSDVVNKLGESFEFLRHIDYSFQLVYRDLGVSFYTCQSDGGNKVFVIRLQPPLQAKTESGIVLGESTFEDVLKIYGAPKEQYNHNYSYKGIEFYYDEEYAETDYSDEEIKLRKVIAINVVESKGLRQCDSKTENFTTIENNE